MELIPIIQSALLIFVVLLTIVITTSYILSRLHRSRQAANASAGFAMTTPYKSPVNKNDFIPLYPESDNEEYKMHLNRMSQYNTPVQNEYAGEKIYQDNYSVNNSYYGAQSYGVEETGRNNGSQHMPQQEVRRSNSGRMNSLVPKYSVHPNPKTGSRFTVINKNIDDAALNAPEPLRQGYSYPGGQNSVIMFK
ncbi:MAG: hypothetical protein ACM3SM_05930 [Bacteroidota bacterium]